MSTIPPPPPTPRETPPRFGDSGSLDRALDLIRFLRANCPWDAEQTPHTLIPHLLEETHEVVDAIREGDAPALDAELGDLLLNLAFQIVLAEENGGGGGPAVYAELEEKMVRRHPQLFGGGPRDEWEKLKAREREDGGVLSGLASGLDPLTKAHRIQERVAGVGFDWPDHRGALQKTQEELDEVREALESGDDEAIREELGDLMFAVVNLARLSGKHAEAALDAANRKFRERFERLEALAKERGIVLAEADLAAMDALWDEIKQG